MKKITRVSLTVCLILVIVSGMSASTLAETASQTVIMAEQRFEKANELLNRKEYKAAIAEFEEVMNISPNSRIAQDAQYWMGQSHFMAGQFDAAQATFAKLIEQYPASAIVAATELMADRVGQAKDVEEKRRAIAEARMRLATLLRDIGNPELTVRKAWDSVRGVMGNNMAISPDGRYLSFCNWENGNLAVRDLATGEHRDITDDATWYGAQSHAIGSVWSPDGKQVACMWSGGGHSGLRIVGLDGSQPRQLYAEVGPSQPRVADCHDWSKDGRYILVTLVRKIAENERVLEIGLVSVADGSVRTLKSQAGMLGGMTFSPDGRYIAYSIKVKEHEELGDIFLLAIDGSGKEVRLTEHPAADFSPAWAPDGKAIAFVSNRDPGGMGLWIRYLVDGKPVGEPQLVKREAGEVRSLGFTRKGSLFYTTRTPWSHIYTASLDVETGKVLAPPALLLREGFSIMPTWSPDGKSLAYVSNRASLAEFGRRTVLVVRSMETGEERELLSDPGHFAFGRPRWSPDGRSIDYGTTYDPLSLIDVQTGHITKIVRTDSRIRGREWSPDGKTIYYIGVNFKVKDWPHRIVALDLETRRGRELYTTDRGSPTHLVVSPDGGQLAFLDADARLNMIPTAGGEPRTLFDRKDLGLRDKECVYGPIAWTPDGRYLLFVREDLPTGLPVIGSSELWRVPAEGGEPQKLMKIESLFRKGVMMNPLSLHPDGKRIAFHRGEPRQRDLWVIDNLLTTFAADK
jgi:Tol biopolymer transport system component